MPSITTTAHAATSLEEDLNSDGEVQKNDEGSGDEYEDNDDADDDDDDDSSSDEDSEEEEPKKKTKRKASTKKRGGKKSTKGAPKKRNKRPTSTTGKIVQPMTKVMRPVPKAARVSTDGQDLVG